MQPGGLGAVPAPDPDNPRCGDGHVDPGEDCDNPFGFCSGFCGLRYRVDYGCTADCTCPHVEVGGNSCCGRVFHDPGCNSEPCQACVCESDPFCYEAEWDVLCAAHAAQGCVGTCDCPGLIVLTGETNCGSNTLRSVC